MSGSLAKVTCTCGKLCNRLSNMENKMPPGEPGELQNVSGILDELQADRDRLVQRFRAPKWLAPGFGLIAAAYVSTPALPGERTNNFVLIAALVIGILLIGNTYRATGIKISRFGVLEWVALAASVLGSLVLFSLSLGLAASGLYWWIAAPAGAAFVMVLLLASVIFSSMRERLRRAH